MALSSIRSGRIKDASFTYLYFNELIPLHDLTWKLEYTGSGDHSQLNLMRVEGKIQN